ncbi:MAG: alkaline phosphatase family protein [Candidatus Limnocylindrales bacterium]
MTRGPAALAVLLVIVVVAGACAAPSAPVGSPTSDGAIGAAVSPASILPADSPPSPTTTASTTAPISGASGTLTPAASSGPSGGPPGSGPASTPGRPTPTSRSTSRPTSGVPTPRPTPAPTPRPTPAPTLSAAPSVPPVAGLPAFRHIYEIVLENKSYGDLVGNPAAPYFNSLRTRFASLTNMYAETHPSEPNYIALFSGSTQGVTDDLSHDLPGRNLVDQLEARGKTWRVFAENVPLGCYTGYSANGGPDGLGTYARKHEPAISFTNISGDPTRCANITDFSHFDPAAADFQLIIPNMCHDMHDCSVATGDRFLADFVPRIVASPAFADSVLFITVDEGTSNVHGGGHVATLVISPLVRAGSTDGVFRNHYSLLRTIEEAWGLGCLGGSCGATDLRGLFGG